MTSLVSIRNLTKTYQRGPEKVHVLHGLDLDITAGDFVALMGPSGSGKTTLLNLIGGLDSPTSGEIQIEGEHIERLSGGQLANWRSRHVGFVFQFYNLMPMLTAQKNVELPLLLTHLNAAQRRRNAEIALTLVGLADRRALLERMHALTTTHAQEWVTAAASVSCLRPRGRHVQVGLLLGEHARSLPMDVVVARELEVLGQQVAGEISASQALDGARPAAAGVSGRR